MSNKTNITNYPEIQDIKQDLTSLKNNTMELGRHVGADTEEQAIALSQTAAQAIEQFKKSGRKQMKELESRVKAKPGQSLAIAFVVGIAASYILGRR